MFTKRDVANYYNVTQLHYENWWGLKKNFSLHYGIWGDGIKTTDEAIANTNRIMLNLSNITADDMVLDAGCGVGGAAIFISTQTKARVTGITLSEKQIAFANRLAAEKGLAEKVSFHLMDYTKTTFADESFDVVWACESMTHAADKSAFIKEAYRLLKKRGRLIVCDFFLTADGQQDKKFWIKKWMHTWFIDDLVSCKWFTEKLAGHSFHVQQQLDYTGEIRKTAKKLFHASLIGAVPAIFYNLFNPGVSKYSKNHYKCGYYQYKALKAGLWRYQVVLAEK
jgi:tocopherol O-methyltransferase